MSQQKKVLVVSNIGTDPEFFLRDKDTNKIVSAINLIPGTKEAPVQIPDQREGNTVQTDNVMVEITVPATNDYVELHKYVRECMDYINVITPDNLEVVALASAELDSSELQDPRALEFGCSPDFNAWNDGMPNESPNPDTNLRSAGAHIHLELNTDSIRDILNFTKALDITLGITSVILDPDKRRKQMYGKAGAFRLKPYGMEYRVLSNFWVSDLEGHKYMFEGVNKAVELYNSGRIDKLSDTEVVEIQTCINTGDETLAISLVEKFGLNSILLTREVYID